MRSDAEAVWRLRRVLREEEAGSVRGPDEKAPAVQEERARIEGQGSGADARVLTLVAEWAGGVVGWLELAGGRSSRNEHRGWVVLAVEADHRRRGVGRTLLESAHDWASRHPVLEQVALRCAATNEPALGLYRGLGYVEEGRFRRALKLGPGRYADVVQLCREVTSSP
jgi:RimJ/RimL family protein N-acetyltransferase